MAVGYGPDYSAYRTGLAVRLTKNERRDQVASKLKITFGWLIIHGLAQFVIRRFLFCLVPAGRNTRSLLV